MKTIKIYYHTGYCQERCQQWKVLPVADSAAEELEGSYESAEDIYAAGDFYPLAGFAVERLLQLERGTTDYISAFIDRIEIVREGTE